MTDKIHEYKLSKVKRNYINLFSIIAIISIVSVFSFILIRQYIVHNAEQRIEEVIQEAEALHYYFQRTVLPAMNQLKDENRLPKDFYSPQMLSSTYVAREIFKQYNLIRKKNNQPLVEYRLASKNPRNKINQADSLEANLIDQFNNDSLLKKYTGVVTLQGEKYLYYARPFLRVQQSCLQCHGNREDAPKNLRDYYHWDSGFNKKVGEIAAIEIIKTPLKAEFHTLTLTGSIIVLITVLFIILIVLYSNISFKNRIINLQKNEIESNLNKLKETQNKLVQSEKMASLGTLTAGVAHEINNPLNFINGAYLGLVKFFTTKAPEYKADVKVLLKGLNTGIERASEVVTGLSRFSHDSATFDDDCEINSIIDNCLAILKNKYKNKIEIEKFYKQKDIVIIGNEGKLHQVFLNILLNAIQSIENTGVISIETQKSKNNVTVTIKDTGHGISREDMTKIIEPFYTTKAPGDGVGLGLSISYNIIKEHKGELQFESEQNQGTTVKIIFPIE